MIINKAITAVFYSQDTHIGTIYISMWMQFILGTIWIVKAGVGYM